MVSFGYDPALSEGAVKPPVFLTSTFAFRSAEEGAEFFDVVAGRKPAPEGMGAGGLVYSRFNHPNTEIVEDRLALFDGAESALVTASGMAAIGAVMLTYLRPGDALVHYTPLYGGTETLIGKVLPGWGIRPVAFTDGTAEEPLRRALEEAARHGPVKMVYLETPANPTNAMIDLALARATVDAWARASGQTPLVVCDNTMLGPVFQTPLAHGVDICVYSLTKYVGGHSDLIAGGITGARELLKPVRQTRSAFGFQLDPHSCWMLARSMETLSLRMERAAESGRKVAALAGRERHPALHRAAPGARRRPADRRHLRAAMHRSRLDLRLRGGERPGAGLPHPERARALQAGGQPRRHRVAGLPPRLDHPFRRPAGGPRRRRRHRGADPPVGRTGAPGRPDPGPGPGLPTGDDAGRIALGQWRRCRPAVPCHASRSRPFQGPFRIQPNSSSCPPTPTENRLQQIVQLQLRRLPPVEDRLHHLRREQRQPQNAADVGRVDALRPGQDPPASRLPCRRASSANGNARASALTIALSTRGRGANRLRAASPPASALAPPGT